MSNSNIKRFLVTLTPLDKFYFGGERTLGTGDYTNYLVKSNYFPQQTGLLGVIRYELLAQKGWLVKSGQKLKPEAKDLIGKSSFKINKIKDNIFVANDFGIINRLSPVFLVDKNRSCRLQHNPLNICHEVDFSKYKLIFNSDNKLPLVCQADRTGKLFKLSDGKERFYEPKDGVFKGLVNDKEEAIKYDDIFIKDSQVGIHKVDKKGAFYKQTFLRLKLGFAFQFYVEMDFDKFYSKNSKNNDKEIIFKSNSTYIGGEKSGFQMDVKEIGSDDWFESIIKPNLSSIVDGNEIKAILLDSHSFVSPDVYDKCEFAITDTVDFRFIETAVADTKNYNNYNPKDPENKANIKKSSKYTLMRAGSILYFKKDELDTVKSYIDNLCFDQIGYNHYTEIKN